MPQQAEVRALLALMLLHHSRRDARSEGGELVLLEEQDRARWDAALIRDGLETLDAARAGLLARLGRGAEAATAYRAALSRVAEGPERHFLERRLAALMAVGHR